MQLLGTVLAIIAFGGTTIANAFQVSPSGMTVVLDGISYFVPPTPVASFSLGHSSQASSLKSAGTLVPFTFVNANGRSFGVSDLDSAISKNGAADDVWSKGFLSGVYILSSASHSLKPGSGVEVILSSKDTPLSKAIPPGPYVVDTSSGSIFEAWRLYSDENQSFLYGTIPDGKGGFTELSANIEGAATVSVAVPSRLYFTPSAQKPLAGARIAIKDIFDIKGLRTGCGNRAFFQLYPPKNATCPAVQRLIDGGAVIVAKAKASQFANGESATDDWVDYHAPYNPRGDGYQDGSSSSTGSGTSIAAYPWLDYAVGSDTGGSMRGPAGANGVFGNRPSHGAVPLDDVMPLSPELDTAGIFSRDAKSWKVAGDWWYQNFTQFNKFPKTILFPTDEWGSSFLTHPPRAGSADAMFNAFIQKLEGFLNTTRTEISLTTLWNASSPLIANVSSPPPPLRTVLNTTYADLITLDQIALVADPFIADFKAAHAGQSPFIDPAPLARWDYGRTLDPATRKPEAITNKTVFMNWFQDVVLNGTNEETCSNAIFLYPQSSGGTFYRNEYISPPSAPFGFGSSRIAVHAEVPDMVVPVGELPYNSTISLTTETLPVTISFIAQKNCDLMLFSLFAALQDAGIVNPVITGQKMFT
ncbi:amidase signature enzyme [Phanerochaete sordida]|uniref:Amidase signature enzyme n=1 Tax=Phanerochaete sordida TaxID=48140 RepID=A0A9P3GNY4_9APHY|nr:amidase signature enzyme [Phanerochaete sordida]